RERLPAHDRRDRQEPGRAEGLDRAALRDEQRGRPHRRLGYLVVPVPHQPRRRSAGSPGRSRPRPAGARDALHRLEREADRRRADRAEHRSGLAPARRLPTIPRRMIYCVIPRELEDELFEKMVEYYKDNPNVTVILDRREGDDRRSGRSYGGKRMIRDRRGAGRAGMFADTDPPEGV